MAILTIITAAISAAIFILKFLDEANSSTVKSESTSLVKSVLRIIEAIESF